MLEEIVVVFGAEFVRRIRSRPFIIGTLIGIGGLMLVIALPSIFERGEQDASKRIVVAGPADLTTPALVLLRRDDGIAVTESVAAGAVPSPATPAFLEEHGHASAVLVLSRASRRLSETAYALDPAAFPANRIARDLAPLDVALLGGIPPKRVTAYDQRPIDVRGVAGRYATRESADVARGVAIFLVTILYIVVLMNSQLLTSSVVEEKTSRIAELLVAAISPSALLGGKVLATGAAGLLQLAVWSAGGLAVAANSVTSAGSSPQTLLEVADALTPAILAAFLAFFVLGFLQYSLLFAAVASLVSRTEELGSVTVPLILPVIAALLIAQYAVATPTATAVVVTSFIPLISPFVMFTRMLIVEVPAWQVAASFAINVAVLLAIVPLAGKVYRVGLLLYGRAPKVTQIWAVLRS